MKKVTLAVILILSITTKLVAQQIHINSVSDTLGYLFDTAHSYHLKYIDSIPESYTPADLLNCGSRTVGDTVFEYSHWGVFLDHVRREEDYWRISKSDASSYYLMYWIGVDAGIRHILYGDSRNFEIKFRTK